MIDRVMKELVSEFCGTKDPMHTIPEEDEMYEQSVYARSVGSDENSQFDEDESHFIHPELSTEPSLNSLKLLAKPSPPELLSKPVNSQVYSEEGKRDGSVMFNYLRTDFTKHLPYKSTKIDPYLDRVTFIGRKMVQIWFGREISLEDFNTFIDLLKDKNYLLTFPLMLESFRKLNYFRIEPSGYQPFCELVLICLTEVLFDKKVT